MPRIIKEPGRLPFLGPSPCPSENTLVELLEGQLSPSERERMEQHLDDCPDCRRVVAESVRVLTPRREC